MPGKGSPEFIALMNKCIEIHYKKNHDYASDDNPFSNFERAAQIASWFTNPIDQVFASLIGIKLARAAELCNGTKARNESLDDTFMDQTNYSGLWGAWHITNSGKAVEADIATNKEYKATRQTTDEPRSIVCSQCQRQFNMIMTIKTKEGNFCSNSCANAFYEVKNESSSNSQR